MCTSCPRCTTQGDSIAISSLIRFCAPSVSICSNCPHSHGPLRKINRMQPELESHTRTVRVSVDSFALELCGDAPIRFPKGYGFVDRKFTGLFGGGNRGVEL